MISLFKDFVITHRCVLYVALDDGGQFLDGALLSGSVALADAGYFFGLSGDLEFEELG